MVCQSRESIPPGCALFVSTRMPSSYVTARGRRNCWSVVVHPCRAVLPMSWMTGLYEHPTIYPVSGDGASFEDVDGHRYLDMNQVDVAGFVGFAPPPVTEALSDQAARGSSFLLPSEDSIVVAENLARRVGLALLAVHGRRFQCECGGHSPGTGQHGTRTRAHVRR